MKASWASTLSLLRPVQRNELFRTQLRRLPSASKRFSTSSLRFISSESPRRDRYQYLLEGIVEDVEQYKTGGFHPIHLGDTFKDGRYCVLHKLGYGGFSTVWLARDTHQNSLVSLKVHIASISQQRKDIELLRLLDSRAGSDPRRKNILSISDDFTVDGPNRCHMCHVSPAAGPSVDAISDSESEARGTRRLRACLARKIAGQLASAVALLHESGIIHGDITPWNVLVQLRGIDAWSTETIYQQLGTPVRSKVKTLDGQKPDHSVPRYFVEPASFTAMDYSYISEQALLTDLGEAFLERSPPPHGVGTPASYRSPELLADRKASRASDIWALACIIFFMRTGIPMFDSFFDVSGVLSGMLKVLGHPPDSFCHIWEANLFKTADYYSLSSECPINDHIRLTGTFEDPQTLDYNKFHVPKDHFGLNEPSENRINGYEEVQLAELLRETLRYIPEERISAAEMATYPWFAYTE